MNETKPSIDKLILKVVSALALLLIAFVVFKYVVWINSDKYNGRGEFAVKKLESDE